MPNQPDRNDAIERLLRDWQVPPTPATHGPCVAPEELAAWLDGGLAESQAARVEAHVASCSACQEALAAFAVSEPDARASRVPGLSRALLPFAAAAVLVVGVWLGTRQPDRPASDVTARQAARLEAPPVEAPPAPSVATPSRSADQSAPPRLDRSVSSRARVAAAPPARDGVGQSSVGQLAQAEPAAPAEELRRVAEQPAAASPPAPANVAEADGARAADAQLRQDPAGPTPQRSRAESAAVVAARPALMAKAADGRVPVASPDGVSRWRIVGTTLEASADGGMTWLPAEGVTAAQMAAVTSGASPARAVNWLVGRGGLVLRTVDGRRFTQATPPAAAALTGVRAVDEMVAEVRAADGRTWRTTDAGRTWTITREEQLRIPVK